MITLTVKRALPAEWELEANVNGKIQVRHFHYIKDAKAAKKECEPYTEGRLLSLFDFYFHPRKK